MKSFCTGLHRCNRMQNKTFSQEIPLENASHKEASPVCFIKQQYCVCKRFGMSKPVNGEEMTKDPVNGNAGDCGAGE